MERGRLISPFGTEFVGFRVTLGGISNPALLNRTYDDIEKILGLHNQKFKTHEESNPDGTFRSYTVEV